MELVKNILKYGFFLYVLSIFIFSFVIFFFHPATDKMPPDSKTPPAPNTIDQIALVETPKESISARLHLIENATAQIDLAYYKWVDGHVSDLMLGSLLEAADRGVQVRILLDGILQLNNFAGPVDEVFLGFKTHPNIELKVFEPFNPFTPLAWNNRMHDKLIVVDHEFGLIGGRNIEDRFYLDDAHKDGLVKDREVLVHRANDSASVLEEMGAYYDCLWNYEHSKEKHPRMTQQKIKKGAVALSELRANYPKNKDSFLARYFPEAEAIDWLEEMVPTKNIRLVSNTLGRTNQHPKALKEILALSSEASESIFIQSPYIIPTRKMLSYAENYAIDPKKTTLFTNSEAASPNMVAISAYNNRRKLLVDSGAKIFEYQQPGSTHGKSAIFDEEISVVGTFNVDPRSSFINTESMLIIESEEFAEELKQGMAVDFKNSLQVGPDYDYIADENTEALPISPVKKIMIRLLSLVTPVFEKLL